MKNRSQYVCMGFLAESYNARMMEAAGVRIIISERSSQHTLDFMSLLYHQVAKELPWMMRLSTRAVAIQYLCQELHRPTCDVGLYCTTANLFRVHGQPMFSGYPEGIEYPSDQMCFDDQRRNITYESWAWNAEKGAFHESTNDEMLARHQDLRPRAWPTLSIYSRERRLSHSAYSGRWRSSFITASVLRPYPPILQVCHSDPFSAYQAMLTNSS